ncbi:MAG: DUF2400 domain-containing protein, partial [Phycisphaerae bacterium]|nr:DUF2400 domain-containing protein [Phycisphaerae bacterium]
MRRSRPAGKVDRRSTMAGTSPPIHAWLEQIYRRYHRPRYVGHDPLARVLVHDDPGDQEVSGLVAALLAYGNVKAILGGIDDVMARLGSRPAGALAESRPARLRRRFQDFRYRVTSAEQMTALLLGVRTIRRRCGSLEAAFAAQVRPDDPTLVPAIGRWVDLITAAAGRPLPHLLPHPARGSACKRVMLYLRWMIRRDAIDPGPWAALPRQKLVVPLDTHLHRMAGRLG